MKNLNPKFIYDKQKRKSKVILSKKKFEKLLENLEDFCDYQLVKARGKKREKIHSIQEVRKRLGIS